MLYQVRLGGRGENGGTITTIGTSGVAIDKSLLGWGGERVHSTYTVEREKDIVTFRGMGVFGPWKEEVPHAAVDCRK